VLEVELDADAETHRHRTVAVESDEAAVGEVGGERGEIVLVLEVRWVGSRERGSLQRGQLGRALTGECDVVQPRSGHRAPVLVALPVVAAVPVVATCSKSFSAGLPQHAQKSFVRGRITAAPLDSMW
jgi:hypothetical protein